jgi:hypothetical protein
MPPDEFRRWYWLKAELVAFARANGLRAAGGKDEVAARIAAFLAGEPLPADGSRKRTARPLSGSLIRDTIIPPGQRLTAEVRAFLVAECGPGFRFDRHMRAFFADASGNTLGDAADHWLATRDAPPAGIDPQFEYNRFVRAWRAQHPGASHAEVTAAWMRHRALPADERPVIG